MTKLFSSDPARAVTVYIDEQPELYELADNALSDGDGTFMYKGRLWEVGEGSGMGEPGGYLIIRPEVPNE